MRSWKCEDTGHTSSAIPCLSLHGVNPNLVVHRHRFHSAQQLFRLWLEHRNTVVRPSELFDSFQRIEQIHDYEFDLA